MGAFDIYTATARCPRCEDLHWVNGQTKFFQPCFSGYYHRHFVPGVAQPLDFSSDELASTRVWEDDWWRVREPLAPDVLHLLTDFDEKLSLCDCGAQLIAVLCFRLKRHAEHGSTDTATLEEVRLFDVVRDDVAGAVDFAPGGHMLWNGKPDAYTAALAALANAPPFDRAALGTTVAGTRCEACGEVRERRAFRSDFPVSFFGPGWTGGELRPGDRIRCDLAWLVEDVDRGDFARLRHPVPRDSLCILGHRTSRGCHCGAGWGSFVLRFACDPGGVVFNSMSLRVVRDRADLADVDFAEVGLRALEHAARFRYPRELTREELIRELLSSKVPVSTWW
jgi:hypothetical protein